MSSSSDRGTGTVRTPPSDTRPAAFEVAVSLSNETFTRIRELVYDLSGIVIGDTKSELVIARLRRRLRELSLASFEEYVELLDDPSHAEEISELVDAITTNVTSFQREPRHFEFLRQELQRMHDAGQRKIRLWSAACSTGEEPYSMAFRLSEVFAGGRGAHGPVDMKILATDICSSALARARAGIYDSEQLDSIPAADRSRCTRALPDDRGFEIVPQVRSLVKFARINLARTPYPMSGPFDLIFCRNVMIYFDDQTRRKFLAEARRLIAPRGHLIVASSESMVPAMGPFRSVAPAVYQPS